MQFVWRRTLHSALSSPFAYVRGEKKPPHEEAVL
jgi:hypothetical protein